MNRALLFAALLALTGCQGKAELLLPGSSNGSTPSDTTPTDPNAPVGDGSLSNGDVFTRLSPTCIACHGTAANKPYFVSLQSFETLLVADRKWIVPGQPDASALLLLLDAKGQGSYTQMPVGGDSFAVKASHGETNITMDELRQWIAQMPTDVVAGPAKPDPSASTIQRKTAAQILTAMGKQLGLTPAEMAGSTFNATDPDGVQTNGGYNDEFFVRYQQLGGAAWLSGKKPNASTNRSFAQQWVPMSQAMCKLAVSKTNNPAIFIDATLSDRSTTATGAPRIQKNIGTLYLRMLGEVPSSADVQALYALYTAKEPASAADGWANVCAALLRDPLWLTY
ncbi:MAG: hypothetical protein ACJ790_00685 [Myxococcaceae bacterium]